MKEKETLEGLFTARSFKERRDSALRYAGIAALSILALWGMRYSAIDVHSGVSEGLVILGAGSLVAGFSSLFFGLRFPGTK
jgi:hypothetical protein